MSKFEDSVKKLIDDQKQEVAQQYIAELYILFSRMNSISRGVMHLLAGEEKGNTGLTDFIRMLFVDKRELCRKTIAQEVINSFDPTTSSKAISDSLQRLIKQYQIEKFWDEEIKRYKYRLYKKE